MKTKQSKVTRRITMALSAIMLSEQLAGTGAVLYAHAEDEIKTEYKIEHSVTSSWEGGCNTSIILTNPADRDTQDWSITFCTTDKITNLWGGTITECLEFKTVEEEAEIEELEEADDKFEDIFESAFKDEFEDDIFADFSDEFEEEIEEEIEEDVEEEYIETSDEENEVENTVEASENATENVISEEVDVVEPAVVEAGTDDETTEAAESTEETDEVFVETQEYDFNAPAVEEYEVYYQYTVKALDYNAVIKAGESVTIGYMAEGNNHDIWDEKADITLKEAEKAAAIPVGGTYEYDDYTVEVKIPAYWDGAYNVQLLITNTSDETIHNWAFVMETANTISGLYNAVEVSGNDSEEDNVHLIKNAGFNQDIPAGDTVEMGYTAYHKGDVDVPDDFALSQIETEVTTAECEVSLFITNEWENGGLAEIIIKNISELPIEDWMIEFDSTLDIEEIWGGVIESHEEDHYFIRNAEYAQNILPGESWTIGLLFSGETTDIRNVEVRQIAVNDEAREIDYEKDTDGDGLPDFYENFIGTDPKNKDTDGDRLSDYEECFLTLTDPLVYDSEQKGVSDYDVDSDSDGLPNGEELQMGLDPVNSDTDNDGLNDGEEKKDYHTDPLDSDVDKDGIPDGDEVKLGLNPQDPATFGIPDGEYIVAQKIESNNKCVSYINKKESAYQISLEVKAAGLAERNMEVYESAYSKAMDNDAIVGLIPSFEYDGTFEEMTLKFQVADEYTTNRLGTYSIYNHDLKDLRRLCIGYYSEELNICMPIATYYDEASNVVYTTVQMEGTYCLMDLEIWFDMLGIEPVDLSDGDTLVAGAETPVIRYYGGHTYAFYEEEWDWSTAKNYCEQAGGHLLTICDSEEQEFVEEIISSTAWDGEYWIGGKTSFDDIYEFDWVTDEAFLYSNWAEREPGEGDNDAIYLSDGNDKDFGKWYTENRLFSKRFVCEWDEIWTEDDSVARSGEYNGNSYALFSGGKNWDSANEYCEFLGGHLLAIGDAKEQEFIEKNIISDTIQSKIWVGGFTRDSLDHFEWVTGQKFGYTNWRHGEPNWDYEKYVHIYSWADSDYFGLWNNEPSSAAYPFICEWEGTGTKDEEALEHLYFAPTWTKVPSDFGRISSLNNEDYDDDGLHNCDEIAFGKSQSIFQKDYPNIKDIYDYYELKYGTPIRDTLFKEENDVIGKLGEVYIVLVESDPTQVDSDGDLFLDNISGTISTTGYYPYIDPNPLKSDVRTIDLEQDMFSVRYRILDGTTTDTWTSVYGTPMSYGGNQHWFQVNYFANQNIFCSNNVSGFTLGAYGCGVQSIGDSVLYQIYLEKGDNFTMMIPGLDSSDVYMVDMKGTMYDVDYESYMTYITAVSKYFKMYSDGVYPHLPQSIQAGTEKLYKDALGWDIDAKWYGESADEMIRIIKNSVNDNVAIPVAFHTWFNSNKLKLYYIDNGNYIEYGDCKSHYMLATGVVEYSDDVKGLVGHSRMIRVATVGNSLYFDYDQYIKNRDLIKTFSGVLRIL